jgi:hypothetical protein
LLLSFAEACNKEYNSRPIPSLATVSNSYITFEFDAAQYRYLFTYSKGDYLISSCKKGQVSKAISDEPGYFTLGFKEAFSYYVDKNYQGTANWDQIIQKTYSETIKRAKQNGEFQEPQSCQGSGCY